MLLITCAVELGKVMVVTWIDIGKIMFLLEILFLKIIPGRGFFFPSNQAKGRQGKPLKMFFKDQVIRRMLVSLQV